MKIIITGGMGFIGSHLADELLKSKNKIILFSKSYSKKSNISHLHNKVKIEKIDVTKFSLVQNSLKKHKPDIIIHLAGNTSHSKSFENPHNDLDSNTKSTLNFLESIRILNLKCRFVLGSTFIVIGKPRTLPINEKSECHPTTLYGVHRLTSEYYCKIYHDVYGFDTVIFRITNSYGPRENTNAKKNAINYLINEAFHGNNITIYNKGNYFRDLIYIEDVVRGISTLIQKGKSGELYWISSFKKTWLKDFGKILESLTQSNVKYVEAPTYTKKTDVGNFVVDNNKLQKLGWVPKTSLELGIKKTLDYINSQYAS